MKAGDHETRHKLKEISVFFPCYNEADNITNLVERTIKVLDKLTENYQVIIVNDGSQDETQAVAEGLASRFRNVEVCNHRSNLGYGAALRSGFARARKELVFYTDGDAQFDIRELSLLVPLIDHFDIVSGYRTKRADSFARKVNAGIFNLAVFLLFGLRLRDIDCAFKLYRREIFERIEITSTGALVDAEILVKAKKLGYSIGQIGVSHFPRNAGKQTGANLKVILRAIKEIMRLRLDLLGKQL